MCLTLLHFLKVFWNCTSEVLWRLRSGVAGCSSRIWVLNCSWMGTNLSKCYRHTTVHCNQICKQLWSFHAHILLVMFLWRLGCINGFRVYMNHLKYDFNCFEVKRSCHLIIYSYQWRFLFKLEVKINFSQEKWSTR